jgi:hypothetical protein
MPTSSTLSSLHIPRSRPLLASSQSNGGGNKSHPITHHHSSTMSSNFSKDFAIHDRIEAQRVKKRWELARSREANAYGMGGWSAFPQERKEKITTMRKTKERGREQKGVCTTS